MKILADQNIPFVEQAFAHIGTVQLFDGRRLAAATVRTADVLLVRSVTRVDAALLASSQVKFVASATIGTDHIDLDYLAQSGIGFANAPASNAISAAEYVICALFYFSQQAAIGFDQFKVAIVGYGNVGSRVAQRLEALGIEYCVYDPPRAQQYQDRDYVDWQTVCECNIVTAHVPLTRNVPFATQAMFAESFFAQLAPGSLFINTSRGATVDEQALLKQLETKELHLILDVWQHEPAIDKTLLQKTLISTPHIAGYSFDGKCRGTEMIYNAVCRHFDITPQWNARQVLAEYSVPRLSCESDGSTTVSTLIPQAYDIAGDSQRLRARLDLQSTAWGEHFDYLRRHYPRRREFSAYQVETACLDNNAALMLEKLGFHPYP